MQKEAQVGENGVLFLEKPKVNEVATGPLQSAAHWTAASNLLCTGVGMGQGYLHSYNFITAAFSRKVIFFICSANEAEEEWRVMWHASDFINPSLNSRYLGAGNKKVGLVLFSLWLDLKVVLQKLVKLHYSETGINARVFGPVLQIIA